jgi:NAD+ synthase (glutamine-hydrolysing)
VRVALCQLNTIVGDLDGNADRIVAAYGQAQAAGCDVAVFPELAITGYPPEDLLLKPGFVKANRDAMEKVAATTATCTAIIGFVDARRDLHNAAAVCAGGRVHGTYHKRHLPNYAVFDEQRYFIPGSEPMTIDAAGERVGLTICEDVWVPGPPAQTEVEEGARLIVNPSGSPYHRGKGRERETMFAERARSYGAHFLFCNLVGGQDELVFDGQSLVIGPEGEPIARAVQFEEELLVCDIPGGPAVLAQPLGDLDEVYEALVLGLRDYVFKNGFEHVGIALSGGIDSALVAMLAADAVGPDRLTCVVMPSPHSSSATQEDARNIAGNLGCELIEIDIEPMMAGYERALGGYLNPGEMPEPGEEDVPRDPARPSEPDLAAENIQARIRGNLMMALSNRHGWLVLTTGNKSEMSVGYATLYGDMAGGFAVIKDVPKTLVYELVRRRNERAGSELVPASVIDRAPSAELRPGQVDSDSLPPYELLDRILEAYVERDEGREEMIAAGMPAEVVDEVIRLVDRSEYKRRQAAPGIRITPRAFGKDRRLPITNRFGG